MVKINFTDHAGTTRSVDVEAGATVMEAAIRNAIPGIEAECGGACACATCHVYADGEGADRLPPVGEVEEEMLESASAERLESSRLSCQLNVTGDIETLVVRIPDRQS